MVCLELILCQLSGGSRNQGRHGIENGFVARYGPFLRSRNDVNCGEATSMLAKNLSNQSFSNDCGWAHFRLALRCSNPISRGASDQQSAPEPSSDFSRSVCAKVASSGGFELDLLSPLEFKSDEVCSGPICRGLRSTTCSTRILSATTTPPRKARSKSSLDLMRTLAGNE